MLTSDVAVQAHSTISEIAVDDWDACACPESADGGRPLDPFTTHRFMAALEASGSVGSGTGWQPLYLSVKQNDAVVGTAPLFVKLHSQGEFIFDHNWAHAYEQAGGRYYPKLQIAVPFTPATGRRLLTQPNHRNFAASALVQGAMQVATQSQLSSLHITFCTQDELELGEQMGLLPRLTQQFHWEDDNFGDFDGFLASLASRKRKNIRKERERANAFFGQIEVLTADEIESHHWEAFWSFYQHTSARKWGIPYLTRGFFDEIHRTMRDDVVLILARDDDGYFAGALNFIGRNTLFGRYWGCIKHHPCLHFELCYYRAIEWALSNGLSRVEAGAQGGHKLSRGYLPSETYSLHWVADHSFSRAIEQFLRAERSSVNKEIEIMTDYGPFKKINVEEQD
ncbi:MAG: GNAT family N-acetyltransferase [Aestuariivita sp.]|nr:GNAT family N-acetyltransferase [Aestuariivita sp.]MCY4201387.1 GNAT family N-acetyltransferase [Aestuariivita sp.]